MQMIYGAHIRGEGVYHPEKKIFIPSIPKNASTTLRNMADQRDAWVDANAFDVDVDRYAIILRDPYDRFLSALNMRIYMKNHNTFFINQIFDKCDLHLLDQFAYLKHIIRYAQELGKDDDFDFFYYNRSIINEINVHYGGIELHRAGVANRGTRFVLEVDRDKVKEMYAKDYKLIEEVEFKNRGPQ